MKNIEKMTGKEYIEELYKKGMKTFGKEFVNIGKELQVYCYHPTNAISSVGGYDAMKIHALDEEVNDKTIYIGMELEMGADNISENYDTIITYLYENFPCILEHDSSIGRSYDIEMISQPMTYKAWLTWAPKLKEILKNLTSWGFQSHNLNTCGLHFHYSLTDSEHKSDIVNRLWEQIHAFENEVHKIAGRGYVYYASDLNCSDAIIPEEKLSIDYIDKKVKERGTAHELVVNIQHPKDIEIRMCRGTLNFDTLMARLEFFYNMYIQACDLKTIVQRMTWGKLLRGDYIKQYVKLHDITTMKKIYDYSTKVKAFTNKLMKYDDNLLTTMTKTLSALKKLSRSDRAAEDYDYRTGIAGLITNITDSLVTISHRFIDTTRLTTKLKYYTASYFYSQPSDKENIINATKDLKELLDKKPVFEKQVGSMEV